MRVTIAPAVTRGTRTWNNEPYRWQQICAHVSNAMSLSRDEVLHEFGTELRCKP